MKAKDFISVALLASASTLAVQDIRNAAKTLEDVRGCQ